MLVKVHNFFQVKLLKIFKSGKTCGALYSLAKNSKIPFNVAVLQRSYLPKNLELNYST